MGRKRGGCFPGVPQVCKAHGPTDKRVRPRTSPSVPHRLLPASLYAVRRRAFQAFTGQLVSSTAREYFALLLTLGIHLANVHTSVVLDQIQLRWMRQDLDNAFARSFFFACFCLPFTHAPRSSDGNGKRGITDSVLLRRAALVSALCLKRLDGMEIQAGPV